MVIFFLFMSRDLLLIFDSDRAILQKASAWLSKNTSASQEMNVYLLPFQERICNLQQFPT